MSDKPKEWWITPEGITVRTKTFKGGVHVIEYSAYKDALRMVELQDKLLACYRFGKQPGKWLDEMHDLRERMKSSNGKDDGKR